MKLCTYSVAGGPARVGIVDGDDVHPVDVPDMRSLFERGVHTAAPAAGEEPSPLADVKLHPPITPKKFFHTAGNFREHDDEGKRAGWSHDIAPWIQFFQNVDALVGDGDPVVYPEHLTEELDYELELALVIGKSGKFFDVEAAEEYIGGYVIFNDITARDIQRREMQSGVFSFCKAIDTFCPLGPWITTPDEIPDVRDLTMQLFVNGELRQDGHSSRMTPTVAEVLAHYSPLGYTAGDVVSLGTVSGVAAFSADPEGWYLKPGDVMEARIERLGTLTNPVVSWAETHGAAAPAADRHVAG
jgi:2-keto-4-pentenoate hydratase/2-oxohepta-3-ene-1,7-dioic acid hydratase in catechol pathway